MAPLCYRRHRFPPEIIQHAIWLYLRFTLSYRDVEELLAKRGLDISYETVRRWVLKFGPAIARRLRQRRPRPSNRWHLDEMVVRIAGERLYLWRAVDDEGEVLDMLVQRRRDSWAALRLMRKLLKKQGFVPKLLVTDRSADLAAAPRSNAIARRARAWSRLLTYRYVAADLGVGRDPKVPAGDQRPLRALLSAPRPKFAPLLSAARTRSPGER